MKDLGTVRPGSTIYIEFDSFGASGESITLTGLLASDVEVYKDGSTTQRASDAGYTLLDTDGIDFDALTGIHGLSINLADNTTAGFWAAGSHYRVVISSVTINAQTVSFTAATFRIGYEHAVLNTTIATLSTQTSFTLTSGPAEDDALNGCVVCIHDVASAVQLGFGVVSDYTGSTKTVTLTAGVTFTAAATDNISFFPPANAAWGGGVAYTTTRGLAGTALPNAAADAAGGLVISDAGGFDIDNRAPSATSVTNMNVVFTTDFATNYNTTNDQWSVSASAVASVTGAVGSVTGNVGGNVAGSVGSVTGNVGGNVAGSVGSVTGNVGGNVTGSVGSVVGGINTGAGVITTLDGLDTAQDTQHSTTQARLPAALVGGRMDSSVGAMAANVLTATAIAADALAAAKLATDACQKIAAVVLRRTMANIEADSAGDTLDLSSLYGVVQQLQESAVSGTTLTVNKTDGTTALGTKTLATSASADPVTGIS